MPFITTADFDASIHDDILNALTKGNETVTTDNIERAVDEVRSYTNGRYDNALIYSKVANERNRYMVRLCVTLAVYYCYLAHNPRKITQTVVTQYEKALEDLKAIQAGKINPEGLPVPVDDDEFPTSGDGQSLQWGSDYRLGMDW